MTLGGRRVPVQRQRARASDNSGEVALKMYARVADRDPLTKVVLSRCSTVYELLDMDAVDRLTVKLRVPTDNPLVLRVLARNNADVDDGWLCDKGRFAYSTRRLTRTRDPVG